MAGPACKIIIDHGFRAASTALEQVLLSPLVYDKMLKEELCLEFIQRLADIDIAAYKGSLVPHGGLVGVMIELEELGVLTSEIWEIFAKPTELVEEE